MKTKMTRRTALGLFASIPVFLFRASKLKGLGDESNKDWKNVETIKDTKCIIYENGPHGRYSYLYYFKDWEGITYTQTPNALIDWNTMEVCYEGGHPDLSAFATRTIKFRGITELCTFVKNNKHHIVIYDAFLSPPSGSTQFSPIPGPMLRYAKKPYAELI